jgi:putative transposase
MKYDGSKRRHPGRPRTQDEMQRLVVRMATENRDWTTEGYRERWPIWAMGVTRSTIANILKEHGLEPASERNRKSTWKELLSRHREVTIVRQPERGATKLR